MLLDQLWWEFSRTRWLALVLMRRDEVGRNSYLVCMAGTIQTASALSIVSDAVPDDDGVVDQWTEMADACQGIP